MQEEPHESVPHPAPSADELKVLTLNYCGIMNNPFEFYSQLLWKELSEISQIFDEHVRAHFGLQEGAKFKWSMGKVEQKVRVGRYSPSFDPTVGIHEDGTRFVTLEEFRQRWYTAYNAMVDKSGQTFDQANIEATLTYDLIYFHTLLRYVFKKGSLEELLKEDPQVYRQALRRFYEQSFLDEKRKLGKVQATLLKLDFDVLFLQEYSPLFEEFIAQEKERFAYQTDGQHDTIIVVKRASFKTIGPADQLISEEERKAMNWAGKTAFLLVDNIILINAHLSSDKDKNGPQVASLRETLLQLKQKNATYHIILGGDLNSFVAPEEEFCKVFQMFPREEEAITTVKMRTKAQGQYDKGNVSNVESKDKIITDLPIVAGSGAVTFIDGHTVPDAQAYVPADNHPFDHFLLACNIARH